MMQELAGATVIGPILAGVEKPIQICSHELDRERHSQHGGGRGREGGRMTVWNLGSINVDLFYRLPHLPHPGETLPASSHQTGLGGKGANQSVAIARAGAKVQHIGMIGADNAWVLDRLAGYGVDVSHVGRAEAATGHAIIMVDEFGENSIVTFAGANYAQLVDKIEAALSQRRSRAISWRSRTRCRITPKRPGSPERRACSWSIRPRPSSPTIAREMLPHVDLLVLNEIEAEQLGRGAGHAGRARSRCRTCSITLGARGAGWRDQATGRVTEVAAFPVEPVDTTGAGDCFIGYVLAGLDQGLEPGRGAASRRRRRRAQGHPVAAPRTRSRGASAVDDVPGRRRDRQRPDRASASRDSTISSSTIAPVRPNPRRS